MAYRKGQGSGLSPATRITQEIIARLEAGTKPWIKPWRGVPVSRPLRACGIPVSYTHLTLPTSDLV